jgi:hypothetical protein
MKKKKFTKIGKKFCLFISLVLLGIASQAQTPSTNIRGPLLGYANGENITITSQIAYGSSNPQLNYTLQNNTSGAYIVSQGTYSYDAAKDEGTQSIVINPGFSDGNFTVVLEVVTPKGVGKSSKSVTVERNNPTDGSN